MTKERILPKPDRYAVCSTEGIPIKEYYKGVFENHSILLTTHWDSHFSMLCSDKNTVNKIVKSCNLEGFYCVERTKVYWSLYQC
ncbi:hypothetical protein GI482_01535 [Bacillus sp. N3536]|nr:hypothetical protein GI482_01535 [Bacillus sp. N3536]